jgi:DNA modification methylase
LTDERFKLIPLFRSIHETQELQLVCEVELMSKAMVEKIELWDVARLIPNARNARTHSDAQIAEIAGSIAAFGFMTPVLVDGAGVIIAGHGRVLAARQLRLDRVPVIVVEHLNDTERRAYAIADNKIALNAGWDEELLRVELEALKDDGIALETVGFSEQELDELLDGLNADQHPGEDEVPEAPAEPVTRAGDVWLLGEHRLLCGDATDGAAYSAVLSGEQAGMVFSDPPYNVSYKAPGLGVAIVNDNLGHNFGLFLENACTHMLQNTRGALYICMSSSELHTLFNAFTKTGGHWSTFVIWGKHTFTLGRADYQRQFEPILYGWREGQPHYWCGARDQGDLWLIDRPAVNDLHPTMKPVELIERAVVNSSQRGETVLDPFAGSGSTLIACEKTGRKGRLIEIEPGYCDVIVRRWQEFTGKEAVLEATKATFATTSMERTDSADSTNDSGLTTTDKEGGIDQ